MRATMMAGVQAATLPERLAAWEKAMTARLDGLRKLKAAIDPLYAGLSAEQKKSADELVGMGMSMAMGGPHMR